jgi:dipeptidyl aminopeptidase/acylaminoacyl peptidase
MMLLRRCGIALVVVGLGCGPRASRGGGQTATHRELGADGAVRAFLAQPLDEKRRIEFYWMRPSGPGPFPVLVFLHGHQEPAEQRIGGRAFVDWGSLREAAASGVVAVAISQPGYGSSDGPPDYCGPATQDAVIAVLEHFRDQPFVDRDRMVVEGISRGAIVAAMVASRYAALAGVVLISGVYDLKFLYERDPNDRILQNLSQEARVLDSSALAARSALEHVAQIKTPVLLLSGAKDIVATPEGATVFAEALRAAGDEAEVVVFPKAAHHIPTAERAPIIARFLNRTLRPARPFR